MISKELLQILQNASLGDRSLIYGLAGTVLVITWKAKLEVTQIAEEFDFPLTIMDGKENEQPTLRVGLKWDGRQPSGRYLVFLVVRLGREFYLLSRLVRVNGTESCI